jgi:hypothetical protein
VECRGRFAAEISAEMARNGQEGASKKMLETSAKAEKSALV